MVIACAITGIDRRGPAKESRIFPSWLIPSPDPPGNHLAIQGAAPIFNYKFFSTLGWICPSRMIGGQF